MRQTGLGRECRSVPDGASLSLVGTGAGTGAGAGLAAACTADTDASAVPAIQAVFLWTISAAAKQV